MKEILIRFESEEDYKKFIDEVVIPSVEENQAEFDAANNIVIVKQLNNN